MTATHTRYFDDAAIAPLTVVVDRLRKSWDERKPHMAPDVANAGEARLAALTAAVILPAEQQRAREALARARYALEHPTPPDDPDTMDP